MARLVPLFCNEMQARGVTEKRRLRPAGTEGVIIRRLQNVLDAPLGEQTAIPDRNKAGVTLSNSTVLFLSVCQALTLVLFAKANTFLLVILSLPLLFLGSSFNRSNGCCLLLSPIIASDKK